MMPDNTEPAFISPEPPEYKAMDFEFLRQEGIKHIQQLAGKVWTDHNTHDPGITILDQLCYAITDLSYRINYDIKDLLADEDGDPYKSLFTPAEILTVNPVTALDIRKVVLDVDGVKNAWIEKATRSNPEVYYDTESRSLNLSDEGDSFEPLAIAGLYRVLIEKSESTAQASEILPNVTNRLNACRNLCEDFVEITILSPQFITISGSIEVGKVEDVNTFAANMLFRVASFISPQIKFYTLQELLDKGKRIDEIFEGPVLYHGFIDDDEVRQYDKKIELHTSDIIRELMDEPEVIAVNQIALSTGSEAEIFVIDNSQGSLKPKQNWRLMLDKEKVPKLDLLSSLQNLRFLKNGTSLTVDPSKVETVFNTLRDANLYFELEEKDRNLIPVPGTFRNISAYYSIQNHFPLTYGIGQIGLPESAPAKRIAQAKQLKAFLMFSEQILGNYFQQVSAVKELFSFFNNDGRSYFSQSLRDLVPGAEEIIYNPEHEKQLQEFTESSMVGVERKNRFLNHLLARFSESLTDYSLWLYNQVISARPGWKRADLETSKKLMNDKLSFLRNYPSMSNDRGKAFNYKLKSWNTENISGLEKRIAGKLGILDYTRRNLADNNDEGFHMLEHILLRPIPEDLSSLIEYLVPKYITAFEKVTDTTVLCTSPAHGLQNGEEISIRGSIGYNDTFTVQEVKTDTFQIAATYTGPGNVDTKDGNPIALQPSWVRTEVNTRILLLTKPITAFSASSFNNKDTVLCQAPGHGLASGDAIEIVGTFQYNGSYNILNATTDAFEIPAQFNNTIKETGGRWISAYQKNDPYSLQLTFIFPDRPEPERAGDRFQNNNFRSFIENTIREQTPVHLTVYIQWLGREELAKFEKAYETFLDQLSNNQS